MMCSRQIPSEIRSGIEVVITGLTRNQFVSNHTWVRIPPAAPTIETCFLIRSKAGFFLILEKILANDLYSATFKVLFTEIYHVNPHISNNSHYIKYAYP